MVDAFKTNATSALVWSTVVVSSLSGSVASQPICSPDALLPDQRNLSGHRHCRQVHRCWSCHSGCGRLRSWNRNSVRQPHHWLCQVEFLLMIQYSSFGVVHSTLKCFFRKVLTNLIDQRHNEIERHSMTDSFLFIFFF